MKPERELASTILDVVEDYLAEKGVKIPNAERPVHIRKEDGVESAILYGTEYYALEDWVTVLIQSYSESMPKR